MVFTSDLHYGITRPHFRGQDSVASSVVNGAQAAAINSLYKAGIKSIEAVIVTGDLTNRGKQAFRPLLYPGSNFYMTTRRG